MATGLVRCDKCEKAVKQEDAHGWLDVRVWVTKPSQEALDQLRQDPTVAKLLDAQGVQSAELPALVGGDFCTIQCLLDFYNAQQTLESLPTTEDRPVAKADEDNVAKFERFYEEREAAREAAQDPPFNEGV